MDKIYSIKSGYVFREIAGEFLVVPVTPDDGVKGMMILNPVSALLWQMLQSGKTVEELLKGVTSEFDVADDEARADILDFLAQLDNLGLLKTDKN
ncbi:MAG: PqqD family protein [Ruminococcaceae bacterium]|nr:PqqD family protein [Oscillospiraceae bacterium]